jgi:mycothiol synthase
MISSRQYAGEADYECMRQLLIETYQSPSGCHYTLGDLDWWRSGEPNPDALSAYLWFEANQLVGFAWPGGNQVDIVTHPAHRHIDHAILTWAEQHYQQNMPEESVFQAWSCQQDAPRISILRDTGYQSSEAAFNFYGRSIQGELPSVVITPGYTVRNFTGTAEIEARVAVHRDAFAPSRMTIARHSWAMRLPTYRLDLDLVAEAPDQTLAAFCIVWFDQVNRMGAFEPVGCHSEHRRRGLASAVMIEGMHRLQALGATKAHVLAKADDPRSNALYTSLGFQLVDRIQSWQRTLPAYPSE